MNHHINRRTAAKLIALQTGAYFLSSHNTFTMNKTMQKRRIPSTLEEIPVVGLGTWQTFDVGNSAAERAPLKEVLRALIDAGGSVIDSSPMYGRSEEVVGDLTTELNIKNSIFESTKVWTEGKEAGIRQMDDSMRLMQAAPIDLMQIHNLLDWKTHMKTLKDWKAAGKIKYIGITHYHSGGYAEMENIMRTEDALDFIQINYNLQVRGAADRILPLARDKGIAVLINRPYEGGNLFRTAKGMTLPDWANEFDAHSWGQIFLKFILAHPAVTCVIPGTSKAKHMLDNVQAGFGSLPSNVHQKKLIELFS